MKIYQFVLLIPLLFANLGLSQLNKIDSLKTELKTTKNDTVKCNILSELVNLINDDGWKVYHTELKNICKNKIIQLEDSKLKDFYLFNYANCLQFEASEEEGKGNYSNQTLGLYLEAGRILADLKKEQYLASVYGSLGKFFQRKIDFINSLQYYNKALAIYEKAKNHNESAAILNNMAGIYTESDKFELAIKYYKECLIRVNLDNDVKGSIHILNNIGSTYNNCQQNDSAIAYLTRSLYTARSINYIKGETRALNLLSSSYLNTKDYEKALEYNNEALKMSLLHNLKKEEANSYLRGAGIWKNLKDLNKAKSFGLKGLQLAKELNDFSLIRNGAFVLTTVFQLSGNYKEALEMNNYFHSIQDSINNNKTEKALFQSQLTYQYQTKALADSLKTAKEKELFSIQIENEKKQKLLLYILIFIAIVFSIFMVNRFRVTRKQKKVIEMANSDLGRQHLLNQKIFSVISHDFRGPLLSLDILLNTFRKRSNDSQLNNFVVEVNTEVANANEILNNLLNWARTEINIKSFEKTNCLFNDVLKDIANELKNKLTNKSISLINEVPQEAIIQLPPDILRIVLRNLISNAVKYSHTGGEVKLLLNGTNSFSVKDYGIGIAQEKLKQLFTKEVDTNLGTNNEEGFGIGLYIVSELLYKYGYLISGESEIEKGSVFVIKPIN